MRIRSSGWIGAVLVLVAAVGTSHARLASELDVGGHLVDAERVNLRVVPGKEVIVAEDYNTWHPSFRSGPHARLSIFSGITSLIVWVALTL